MRDKWLFCCLTDEQKNTLKENDCSINPRIIFDFQKNLKLEGKTIKCDICGKKYPISQVEYNGELIELENLKRPRQKPKKYGKVAEHICSDHYYGFYKKTFFKSFFDKDINAVQADEIAFKGEQKRSAISCDERFVSIVFHNGSISIIDIVEKRTVAKKTKSEYVNVNSLVEFDDNNNLLIFTNGRITSWDFLNNKEEIIWSAPEGVFHGGRNVVRNRKDNKIVFYCLKDDSERFAAIHSVVLVIGSKGVEKIVSIPGEDMFGELSYSEEQGVYSLCIDKEIRIYDKEFQLLDQYQYPSFNNYMNGGGLFPIMKAGDFDSPHIVVVSPNGKWLLLKYLTKIILLKRDTKECVLCVDNNRSPGEKAGFIDEKNIWYTQGRSTYIQEI